VTRLGRSDGDPLTVDLSDRVLESPEQLWEALAEPCGLPSWFGRNLAAWNDTLYGGISETLDDHPLLVIRVRGSGIFAPGEAAGQGFINASEGSGCAHVVVVE
jgi:hypothetical protein